MFVHVVQPKSLVSVFLVCRVRFEQTLFKICTYQYRDRII